MRKFLIDVLRTACDDLCCGRNRVRSTRADGCVRGDVRRDGHGRE